jgi:superfamily II DNA/RNA helicase
LYGRAGRLTAKNGGLRPEQFVLQMGNPPDRAQYLHRLGRTARAGRDGAGLLLLCDYEAYWLPQVRQMPSWPRNWANFILL